MKTSISLCLLLAACGAAQTVPDGVTIEKDVVYSQGSRLMMDVARPKGAGPFPAVLAIHGGGFRAGERASYLPTMLRLAQHGYVAATVDYRLAPRSQFPAALQDVKAAVRFLRANATRFAVDPERVAAIGESAGAHLALMLGLTPGVAEFEAGGANREQSSRVACVVSWYAPADFARMYGKGEGADAIIPLFLGGNLENAKTEHLLASPLNWVTPLAPPVLAIHGTKDPEVPYEQSQWLVEQLQRAGARAELETIEGGGHGFQGKDAEQAERRMVAFLDENLGLLPSRKVLLVADHGARGQIVAIDWQSGRELWSVPNRNGHDVQPLPGGHVLYTMGNAHQVVEMDADHKPVWTYGPEEGLQHPISAQRLENGNTLIGDAELGKVIEIDRDRKVVWKYESEDLAKMRMRNSRRIAGGTTLISVEAAGKIIEVNQAGEIVWSYTGEGGAKRRPYKGVRLPNGNTLITMTDPGELVEVDRSGKIVRSIAGEKTDIRLVWASGFDVLPSGNVLVSDYQGRRVIEVDKSGKVVHEVRMPTRATASIALVP
jgi:acetyl esterase/lipase